MYILECSCGYDYEGYEHLVVHVGTKLECNILAEKILSQCEHNQISDARWEIYSHKDDLGKCGDSLWLHVYKMTDEKPVKAAINHMFH